MDKFKSYTDTAWSPAREAFVVTPHDTNPLPDVPKAIRAPSAGVITLRAVDSSVDVAHPVLEGEVLQVRVAYVRSTGTTVTGTIVGYA